MRACRLQWAQVARARRASVLVTLKLPDALALSRRRLRKRRGSARAGAFGLEQLGAGTLRSEAAEGLVVLPSSAVSLYRKRHGDESLTTLFDLFYLKVFSISVFLLRGISYSNAVGHAERMVALLFPLVSQSC